MHPKCYDAFKKLNSMLEGKQFVAGDQVTIADFQIYAEFRDTDYVSLQCITGYFSVFLW